MAPEQPNAPDGADGADDNAQRADARLYLIFSQVELDVANLIRAAQRLNPSLRPHQLALDVGGFKAQPPVSARLMLRAEFGEERGEYQLWQRAPSAEDQAAAERAEQSGKAWGMSQLSARCPWLWELSVAADSPSPAAAVAAEAPTQDPLERPLSLLLCALLAGVALGPVMPPARDTLFGVRGARERAGY